MINSFKGEYRWLSNFAEVTIVYNGITFSTTEAAFQAEKASNPKIRQIFSIIGPGLAKSLGQEIRLRTYWEMDKDRVMYEVNKLKFTQEPYKSKLLTTGDQELVEGNNWGDMYWGVCNGFGENRLGKILMKIREELRSASSIG